MDKVRIGIIGVGNMGSSHVNFISEIPELAELTAICDCNPAKLEKYRDRGLALYEDASKFIAEAPIDAVMVEVPHYDHVRLAVEAIEHGKHVIVEKPISVHKQLAQPLLEAIAAHPELRVSAMFNQRTIDAHRKIKELIDSGKLGELRRINWIITNWFRSQYYYDSGDWRASWRGEGGGVLLNQCPHQLDLLQWFFGMPKRVTAFLSLGRYHDIEVEDDVTAYFEYPNGATGVFVTSTGEALGTNRLEVIGDHGKLVFEDGHLKLKYYDGSLQEYSDTVQQSFPTPEYWDVTVPCDAGNRHQHRNIIENFCKSILKGEKLMAPAQEGIHGLELGNAILLSGLKHRTVELPVDGAEFAAELDRLIATSRYQKKATVNAGSSDFGNSF